jgi:hypothetical protein
MGESSHSVECTRTQNQNDATVDAPSAPAEKGVPRLRMRPDHRSKISTAEGMGVAGKE